MGFEAAVECRSALVALKIKVEDLIGQGKSLDDALRRAVPRVQCEDQAFAFLLNFKYEFKLNGFEPSEDSGAGRFTTPVQISFPYVVSM